MHLGDNILHNLSKDFEKEIAKQVEPSFLIDMQGKTWAQVLIRLWGVIDI